MAQDHDDNVATRRQFIKGTAAGVGALAMMGGVSKNSHASPPPRKWDREVNVLVAGAGVSGTAAAIAAYDSGETEILLLEKTTIAGGSGRFASGTILAAGTPMQKEMNIHDSPELWFREAMDTAENGVDPQVTKKLIDNSVEAYNFWFVSKNCGRALARVACQVHDTRPVLWP